MDKVQCINELSKKLNINHYIASELMRVYIQGLSNVKYELVLENLVRFHNTVKNNI